MYVYVHVEDALAQVRLLPYSCSLGCASTVLGPTLKGEVGQCADWAEGVESPVGLC